MKKILFVLSLVIPSVVSAQNSALSPYGQYGVGSLSDQSTGFNRGMAGVAYGFNESNQVNYLNPASYANIDSLTFIFDVGASLQSTNFKENGNSLTAKSGNFDYAVAAFRAWKGLGISVGIVPFSIVKYEYSDTRPVSATNATTYSTKYSGDGSLRQAFIGAGWNPWKTLTVGANINLVWGELSRTIENTYSDSYANELYRVYYAELAGVKLDFGAQYSHKLNSKDNIVFGVKFSPGMKLKGDYELYQVKVNPLNSKNYSDTTRVSNPMFVPTTIGVGATWSHGANLKVGLDYTYQAWNNRPFVDYRDGALGTYNDVLKNSHKIAVGGDFVRNPMSRGYLNRVHVRGGLSYSTPYIKINGNDGPSEFCASLGLGLPITNAYNNRSILNISAQYISSSASGYLKENTFRINIGLTFNERWFMKWKVE